VLIEEEVNIAATLLLSIALGDQAKPGPIPADRVAEPYLVYSAVVQSPKLSHSASHRKILIQDVTGFKGETPGKLISARTLSGTKTNPFAWSANSLSFGLTNSSTCRNRNERLSAGPPGRADNLADVVPNPL
jgi:hypothetical protein